MFLTNEFTKEYFKIIELYKQQPVIGYCESHHIVPKSLGGSNRKDNIINLPARDHFKCHQLLVKMTEGEAHGKMWSALWRMMNKQSKNQIRDFEIIAEEYEEARLQHAQIHSIRMSGTGNPFFNKQHTEQARERMSKAKKGKTYEEIHGTVLGNEMRERRRIETTGKIRSDETKEKIRQLKLGKSRDPALMKAIGEKLKGRKQSTETIEKKRLTREANKQVCEFCKKELSLSNYTRWHGVNCKLKGIG